MTVYIRGEIDHHTAGEIRSGVDGVLFERRPERLFLNLSSVTFMDSSGLGLIMGRFSVMKELGGDLVVCDPSPEIRGILTLSGMERLVRIEYSKRHEQHEASSVAAPKTVAEERKPSRRAAGRRGRKQTSPGLKKSKPSA